MVRTKPLKDDEKLLLQYWARGVYEGIEIANNQLKEFGIKITIPTRTKIMKICKV